MGQPAVLKIHSAEFWGSAVGPEQYPKDRLPQVGFAGRSNVGKSSLLNALVRRKGLVKTSRVPGKTRTLNFFRVNRAFYLVDLPGYGYAKLPPSVTRAWAPMIETYLSRCPQLRGVVFLLDIRHPPTEKDRQLQAWLGRYRVPTLYVATKADKVGRGRLAAQLRLLREALALPSETPLIPVSAVTRAGVDVLWQEIRKLLEAGGRAEG